jgi:membrane associated rhomboid family serine protease
MFFFIPVGMNYRTDRWPVVTLTLIGINTLVYIVSLICFLTTQGDSEKWIMENLWLIPAKSYIWMYLTSMFVHGGIFHLAGNMIFLFLFGSCVEDMIGRLRFAIFYLIGGLAAELVYIAMSPDHFAGTIPMGGASGAISTCMGMYLMLRAGADIDFKYVLWLWVYIRAGEFSLPAWVVIGFYFLSNLLWAVLGMTDKSDHGGVAFGAHVGGFLAGFAIIGLYKWLGGRKLQEVETEPDLIINPSEIMAARRMTAMVTPVHTGEIPTIFLHDGQAQTGPFTLSQIEAGLRNGTISREAVYWSEGMTEWQGVTELAGGLQ